MTKKLSFFFIFLAVVCFITAATLFWWRSNKSFSKLGQDQSNLNKNQQSKLTSSIAPGEETTVLTATLEVISGTVELVSGEQKKTLQEDSDQQLVDADEVEVAADSLAEVRYNQGTVVRLAPETKFTYHDQLSSDVPNQHWWGSIYVRFKRVVGVQESYQLETPTVVTTVRGTAFSSFVDHKTQDSTISVTDHQVDVTPKKPGSNELEKDSVTRVSAEFETTVVKQPDKASPTLRSNSPQPRLAVVRRVKHPFRDAWLQLNQTQDLEEESLVMDKTAHRQRRLAFRQRFVDKTLPLLKQALQASPSLSPTPLPTSSPKTSPLLSPSPKLQLSIFTSMPPAGYSSGVVKTDRGEFPLVCVGADKDGIKVVTDSGNENTCERDCTVLPLHDYAARNGAVTAMNGSYFCPADYPACAEKKNSFDTLFFNSRSHNYLNSENNVYSVLPFLVIHSDGNARFVAKTQEWGRDTGIQAGIAGNPLLVSDGQQVATEDGLDAKQRTVKSNRGAFVQEGSIFYLCVVKTATVLDSAKVFTTLGADHAINIDGGGSSALWSNGKYILGPGRQIPNAVMFVKK